MIADDVLLTESSSEKKFTKVNNEWSDERVTLDGDLKVVNGDEVREERQDILNLEEVTSLKHSHCSGRATAKATAKNINRRIIERSSFSQHQLRFMAQT